MGFTFVFQCFSLISRLYHDLSACLLEKRLDDQQSCTQQERTHDLPHTVKHSVKLLQHKILHNANTFSGPKWLLSRLQWFSKILMSQLKEFHINTVFFLMECSFIGHISHQSNFMLTLVGGLKKLKLTQFLCMIVITPTVRIHVFHCFGTVRPPPTHTHIHSNALFLTKKE